MDWLGWIPLRWLVVLHVMSAFTFVGAHVPALVATLALRTERDPTRVRWLLALSSRASPWMIASLLVLAASGALLATIEATWRATWVWASALILVLLSASMSPMAARAFNEARHAAGVPWFDGRRTAQASEPDPAALNAALATIRRRAPMVTAIGLAGLVALVWFMTFRPE